MITTALAAFHVLILVASKDLGAALIIFVVYLAMLYVATRQPLYLAAGLGAGSVASVAAYYLFGHVRTRVIVWKDPFASYDNGGYQVAQSLFAIGTGGWFGMGLFKGRQIRYLLQSQISFFSNCGGNGTDFCTLSDPGMWQCLYDVSEYCDAASGQLL